LHHKHHYCTTTIAGALQERSWALWAELAGLISFGLVCAGRCKEVNEDLSKALEQGLVSSFRFKDFILRGRESNVGPAFTFAQNRSPKPNQKLSPSA